jgi:hypothetical protein
MPDRDPLGGHHATAPSSRMTEESKVMVLMVLLSPKEPP